MNDNHTDERPAQAEGELIGSALASLLVTQFLKLHDRVDALERKLAELNNFVMTPSNADDAD